MTRDELIAILIGETEKRLVQVQLDCEESSKLPPEKSREAFNSKYMDDSDERYRISEGLNFLKSL